MGASDFMTWGTGDNAQAAFKTAKERVTQRCEENQELPTGIATKHDFKIITTVNDEDEALRYAEDHIDTVVNKHGSAGCIKLASNKKYLFFGWYPT